MTLDTSELNRERYRLDHLDDVWLFGYGSLIYKAGFDYIERQPATITGWQRRFWQGSHDHRGTPHAPGRVATLVEAPGRFGQFVARLRQDYEFVVIDTADHPEDLDAISAAGVSDGALLVVERNATPLHRLRQLTDGLRESGAALLGAVLTDR